MWAAHFSGGLGAVIRHFNKHCLLPEKDGPLLCLMVQGFVKFSGPRERSPGIAVVVYYFFMGGLLVYVVAFQLVYFLLPPRQSGDAGAVWFLACHSVGV